MQNSKKIYPLRGGGGEIVEVWGGGGEACKGGGFNPKNLFLKTPKFDNLEH